MTEPEMTADEDAAPVAEAPAPQETPRHPQGYTIPDFAEDARTIASFDAARERFERSESQSAEDEIRKDFQRRRAALQVEIATAEALLAERKSKWQKAIEAYGRRYPKSVERMKARKPSFLQNLFSFEAAGRMFVGTSRRSRRCRSGRRAPASRSSASRRAATCAM
jgi:hypothetical protein